MCMVRYFVKHPPRILIAVTAPGGLHKHPTGTSSSPFKHTLMLHLCLISDPSGLSNMSLLSTVLHNHPFLSQKLRAGSVLLPFGECQGLQPLALLSKHSSESIWIFRIASLPQRGYVLVSCRVSLQPPLGQGKIIFQTTTLAPPTGHHCTWTLGEPLFLTGISSQRTCLTGTVVNSLLPMV